ncbi:MAG: RagB/SusD family nutrient uptake outer membrane protein [Chitinophagaceae bacterium]|nr:RagB/SusD family nutrient uptake outer membrane protein [Chitinophagaceae bacterium]
MYSNKRIIQFFKYQAILTLIVIMTGSCKKFLEEVPTGNMTDQTVFTTAQEGAALIIGPYRSLASWTGGADDWGNYLPATLEYPTGKAYTSDTHVQIWKYQTNQISGDMLGNFNNQWNNWYQGVRDCNFAIAKIPGITEWSESDIQKALAEVKTLRAWYYFCLVRYFGDVPLTTTVVSTLDSVQLPRASLKQIYDEVIIPDLEYAVNSPLSDSRSSNGRVTKHVARAILADVYLTCAGYPYQEVTTAPEKNWCVDGSWSASAYPVNSASAKDFLKKAQTNLNVLYGAYTLGSYDDLRDPGKNNAGEAIFQAQYLSGVTNNSIIPAALPGLSHVSMFGDEYGTFIPSTPYFKSYNAADKRIQDRQMFYFSDTRSTKYDPSQGPADKFGMAYLYKFYDQNAIKVTGQSGLNWSFYRYADILLMLTEVNWTLRSLGEAVSDDDVIKGINLVRARASLPAYRATDINLLTIMSERAYELVFENKMLWDQRRTRMCLVDGDGQFAAIESFFGHRPVDFSFEFGPMNLLSPISGTEIINNAQCMQNFGYLPKQSGQ